MCNRRYAVNRIQLLRENFSEKEQKFKVHGTTQKIIWVTAINMDLKSKDKLIRVG